jgi:hypothetical protein
VTLAWEKPQTIGKVMIYCDSDYDHGMETVLYQHPERAVPFCPKHLRVLDGGGKLLAESTQHHQATWRIHLPSPVTTDKLVVEVLAMNGPHTPATLMGVRVEQA